MTRSARHRGPMTPRWVRGLLTGALLAFVSTSYVGLRPRRTSSATSRRCTRPAGRSPGRSSPSQQQRLEEDMEREDRDRVPILDPIPGEFAPATCLDPPSEARGLGQGPQVQERLARRSTRPSGTTSGS